MLRIMPIQADASSSPFTAQERDLIRREERRLAVYEQEGWRVRVVTWQELERQPMETRERVRAVLAPPEGRQGRLWRDDEE